MYALLEAVEKLEIDAYVVIESSWLLSDQSVMLLQYTKVQLWTKPFTSTIWLLKQASQK